MWRFCALHGHWRAKRQGKTMNEIRSAFEPSFLVIRLATLEPQKQSALGRYLARYMTHMMEAARLVAMIIIALGAWLQSPAALVGGFLVIVLAWMRGLLLPGKT